jgi:hypothetical protein
LVDAREFGRRPRAGSQGCREARQFASKCHEGSIL